MVQVNIPWFTVFDTSQEVSRMSSINGIIGKGPHPRCTWMVTEIPSRWSLPSYKNDGVMRHLLGENPSYPLIFGHLQGLVFTPLGNWWGPPCWYSSKHPMTDQGSMFTYEFTINSNCYIYIYASPPPQGLPFKIKSCFQRKVCISDFVRWYSYISNVFLNCFQCNVWVSTRGFAMAVKQFFTFNSSFERINNRWSCCWEMFIVFKHFMNFFCIRKIIKQEKHIKCIYSAFLFLVAKM